VDCGIQSRNDNEVVKIWRGNEADTEPTRLRGTGARSACNRATAAAGGGIDVWSSGVVTLWMPDTIDNNNNHAQETARNTTNQRREKAKEGRSSECGREEDEDDNKSKRERTNTTNSGKLVGCSFLYYTSREELPAAERKLPEVQQWCAYEKQRLATLRNASCVFPPFLSPTVFCLGFACLFAIAAPSSSPLLRCNQLPTHTLNNHRYVYRHYKSANESALLFWSGESSTLCVASGKC
jgi:hypothetical protein